MGYVCRESTMAFVHGFREGRRAGSGSLTALFRTALFPMIAGVILLVTGTPVRAASISINATFDSSITGLSNASSIEGAINAAIGELDAAILSPNSITVSIDFQNMTSGLGQSSTGIYQVSYDDYYNAFKAIAASPVQLTALASLGTAPTGQNSGNPVNGNTHVDITSAEGRNLGFSTPGVVSATGGTFDTVIALNTSITSPPNGLPGFYGLEAVALHEIDESLGIGGTGSTLTGSGTLTGPVGDLDLFRYSASGVRSYSNTQTTSLFSYFSVDGGVTVQSYFNQTSAADFADWLSNPIPAGFTVQVQDAFGQTGTNPALGTSELRALNAIGYELAPIVLPEPSTLFLSGIGVLALLSYRRFRVADERGQAEAHPICASRPLS
jgi:hypothetical protein